MLKSLLLLVPYNYPSASAVATDIAVADVITAVAEPCIPAVVVVSAVNDVPASAVLLLLFPSQEYLLWLKSLLLPPPFCY
jgi:hypothetical protein